MITKIIDVIKDNKSKVMIIVILVLFVIIMLFFSDRRDENKNYKSQKYVYTSETNEVGEYTSKLPYINIDSDEVDNINKEIMIKYYTEINTGEKYADYEYYKNKDIVSLLVKYQYLEGDTVTSLEIDFYNIDINTGRLITNEELYNRFDVNNSDIDNAINNYIDEYYNYETNKNYISNCDLECYRKRFNNDSNTINYYVKSNHLYAYKKVYIDKDLAYDTNAPFELFRFKIK